MNFQALKRQALANAKMQLDRMTAEELLAYVDRAVMPWEERNPNSAVMWARRYAMERLERLTR